MLKGGKKSISKNREFYVFTINTKVSKRFVVYIERHKWNYLYVQETHFSILEGKPQQKQVVLVEYLGTTRILFTYVVCAYTTFPLYTFSVT